MNIIISVSFCKLICDIFMPQELFKILTNVAQEYRTTARRLANVRNLNKINILRRSLFRCHDGLMMMMMMVIHMLLYIHIYIYFFRSYISREWKKRRTSGDYSLLMDNETSYYSIKCDKWLKFRLKTRKDRNETSFFKAFVYFFFSSVFHRSITFMVRAVFTRKKERYLEIVQQRFSREKEKMKLQRQYDREWPR